MTKNNVYICPKYGYVLPKKEATISGWNSEDSSTHIYCARIPVKDNTTKNFSFKYLEKS